LTIINPNIFEARRSISIIPAIIFMDSGGDYLGVSEYIS